MSRHSLKDKTTLKYTIISIHPSIHRPYPLMEGVHHIILFVTFLHESHYYYTCQYCFHICNMSTEGPPGDTLSNTRGAFSILFSRSFFRLWFGLRPQGNLHQQTCYIRQSKPLQKKWPSAKIGKCFNMSHGWRRRRIQILFSHPLWIEFFCWVTTGENVFHIEETVMSKNSRR